MALLQLAEKSYSCAQLFPWRAVQQAGKQAFRRKVYWGGAVEATRGSWVMLYVQYAGCGVWKYSLSRITFKYESMHAKGGEHYQKVVRDAP